MEIEWSVLQNSQLLDIVQYVADNFGQKTATKTLKRIQEKVGRLLLFPESGSYDKHLSTDVYVVRHITLRPNVVYYIVVNEKITIMAIAHEKQSPQTISSMIFRFLEHYN